MELSACYNEIIFSEKDGLVLNNHQKTGPKCPASFKKKGLFIDNIENVVSGAK